MSMVSFMPIFQKLLGVSSLTTMASHLPRQRPCIYGKTLVVAARDVFFSRAILEAGLAQFILVDYNTYHRRHDTSENREKWRRSQMIAKKKEAEEEYAHWVHAHGGVFKDQVRVVCLNNLWCMRMPYFDQVSPNKMSSCLKVIRNHIEEFKRSNLNCAIEDLRWRHVGVRDEGCFIFDLGSLERRDASEIDVDASIATLREKI